MKQYLRLLRQKRRSAGTLRGYTYMMTPDEVPEILNEWHFTVRDESQL